MRKYNFKNHSINKSCSKKFSSYKSYKPYLKEDFSHRCAYCNLRDDRITTYFEVDHFVPKAEFKKYEDFKFLEHDYKNLIYSCKKCNLAKSGIFEGDLFKNPYENLRFYNPVYKDYNEVFYRDSQGNILSDDDLGIRMIYDLKLYHPIHNLNWLCERLELLCEKLENEMRMESDDSERCQLLKDAHYEALKYKDKCFCVFIANYNNSDFSL